MRDVKRNKAGWRFWGAFVRLMRGSSPGATFIEYLMIAGLLALGAITGFKQLRSRGDTKVQNQAKTIANIPGTPALGLIGPGGPNPTLGIGASGPGTGTGGGRRVGLPVIQPAQCFAGGTLVSTAEGDRPIERLQKGDLVWSRDLETGETALQPIVQTSETHEAPVMRLDLATGENRFESILVTPTHPFYVEGRGFTPAREVGATSLATAGGESLFALPLVTWESRETVYHLEVAQFHTYFVGEGHVLVHNACGVVVKSYKEWKNDPNLPPGTQVHHLNQDAVYGERGNGNIPKDDGYSIPLTGSTNEPGSEHYLFHESLERFWEQYRTGDKAGDFPTNGEYGKAVEQALLDAGFSEEDASRIAAGARFQRIEAGYLDDQDVPRIPGRIPGLDTREDD